MKNFTLLFILFVLIGCSKKATLSKDKFNNYLISSNEVFVSDVAIEKWRVGPLRRQKLSKGIRIGVTFPQLDMGDLETLVRETNVDSYILRLKRRGVVGGRVIGHLYVPFLIRKGKTSSSLRSKQMTKGFFFVYYSAAALSARFENMSCPAFNHRYLIKEVELDKHRNQMITFNVSKSSVEKVIARVNPFDYKTVFNGGPSLVGDYVIEMAFFNYEKKERKSSWIELPERVTVQNEFEQVVKGCASDNLPPPVEDTGDPVKRFKFGQ